MKIVKPKWSSLESASEWFAVDQICNLLPICSRLDYYLFLLCVHPINRCASFFWLKSPPSGFWIGSRHVRLWMREINLKQNRKELESNRSCSTSASLLLTTAPLASNSCCFCFLCGFSQDFYWLLSDFGISRNNLPDLESENELGLYPRFISLFKIFDLPSTLHV